MSYFDQEHPTVLSEPVGPNDHARGPARAEVTLVEYGDFACPACRAAYGGVRDLLAAAPDVRFVFRANPRSHLFPDAEPAAEAAEIAAAHGKFWEMHDRLFQADGGLSRARLVALAGEIGLDAAQFERDLADGAYRGAVKAQEVSGWHSHVISTPTFFINGIRFEDALDRLPDAVARARQKVGALRAVFRDGRIESTDRRRRQLITVGPHQVIADLPADEGGEDAGPGPHDLLLASLGACTAMTVQWYAEKHRLPLEHVEVRLSQARTEKGHVFRRSVILVGDLSDSDRAKLERAADACPVSRTLTGGITIETRTAVDPAVEEAGRESFPASDPPPWTSGR